MKNNKLFYVLLFGLCAVIVILGSCKEDEATCPFINCNSGVQDIETCECDCIEGYIGSNCDGLDVTKSQALLNAGETPQTLINAGIPIDSLYGKRYKSGFIFYIDTTDGTGMVASINDLVMDQGWGCLYVDIPNLNNVLSMPTNPEVLEGARIGDGKANTEAILSGCSEPDIAARTCRNFGDEWFLPSRGELSLMYRNLYKKGYGNFNDTWYWCSTEGYIGSWFLIFNDGSYHTIFKSNYCAVRAARAF